MQGDHYGTLGVSDDASQTEIRSAYRAQAKAMHPDRYGGDRVPFQQVNEAYSVLSDPDRRRTYDEAHGYPGNGYAPTSSGAIQEEQLWSAQRGPEPLTGRESPVRHGPVSLSDSFRTFHPSFDDIFDRLWSNFGGTAPPKSQRVRSLDLEIPLAAEDGQRGGEAQILVPAEMQCPACRGSGGAGWDPCWRCAGKGTVLGECPVTVSYPPGTESEHDVLVPLGRFGIHNFYLTVRFRVGHPDA